MFLFDCDCECTRERASVCACVCVNGVCILHLEVLLGENMDHVYHYSNTPTSVKKQRFTVKECSFNGYLLHSICCAHCMILLKNMKIFHSLLSLDQTYLERDEWAAVRPRCWDSWHASSYVSDLQGSRWKYSFHPLSYARPIVHSSKHDFNPGTFLTRRTELWRACNESVREDKGWAVWGQTKVAVDDQSRNKHRPAPSVATPQQFTSGLAYFWTTWRSWRTRKKQQVLGPTWSFAPCLKDIFSSLEPEQSWSSFDPSNPERYLF